MCTCVHACASHTPNGKTCSCRTIESRCIINDLCMWMYNFAKLQVKVLKSVPCKMVAETGMERRMLSFAMAKTASSSDIGRNWCLNDRKLTVTQETASMTSVGMATMANDDNGEKLESDRTRENCGSNRSARE